MITKRIFSLFRSSINWSDIERFDPKWKSRIMTMSSFIDSNDHKVLDIGCGPMWLKEFLPSNIEYIGLDYKDRGEGCMVCNVNEKEIPQTDADVYFISGCLEYVVDVDSFISQVTSNSNKCILSYCCVDEFSSIAKRKRNGWKNHLTISKIIEKFEKGGMTLTDLEITVSRNTIIVFHKQKKRH